MQAKPGDRVWLRTTYLNDGWAKRVNVLCDPGTAIPDHPALPAIARWLSEDEDNFGRLVAVAGGYSVLSSDLKYLDALVAALSAPEEGR